MDDDDMLDMLDLDIDENMIDDDDADKEMFKKLEEAVNVEGDMVANDGDEDELIQPQLLFLPLPPLLAQQQPVVLHSKQLAPY